MEQLKKQPADLAAWRDMLMPPGAGASTLAALMYVFSGVALALSDNRSVCLLFLLCCAVFYYAITRAVLPLLYYAIPAFLLYACAAFLPVQNMLLLPTAFLSILAGGGCGAFLLIHHRDLKRHWPFALLPVASYLIVLLVTGDPLRGLLVLLPLVPALVSGISLLFYLPRTRVTILIATALGATLALAGLVTLAACGALSQNPMLLIADSVRGQIKALLTETLALYAQMGVSLGLSEVAISNVATLAVNLLPGLLLVTCSITAFLVFRTLLQLVLTFRTLPRLPARLSGLTISPVTAVIYLFCYLISSLTSSEAVSVFTTVCENLSLVLIPPLALAGFALLFGKGRPRSCLSQLLLLAMLMFLWISPLSALSLAAALGAANILLARFSPSPDNKGEK